MLKIRWVFVLFCLWDFIYGIESVSINPKPEKILYRLDDIDDLFKEFMTTYNKKYDPAEYEHRQHVFIKNLVKINRWNREQPDAVYKIGPFTDLSFEEFTETHTGLLGNFTNDNAVKYVPKGMAPDSLDWRESNLVTEVKNQGHCGSCYVFSAIGNIEGQHAKQGGQLISLSEQQSLDCYSNGCQGGFPHQVFQALANKGCMSETDYPYEGQQGQCRSDQSKVVVNVSGGSQISLNSEDDLIDAVANYGPLSIGLYINDQWTQYSGGILRPTTACQTKGHAVLLIGYGTDGGTPYWLIKNSWGAPWGEGGYVKLLRGQQACRIGRYAATATVA